jgi:acetyl esterase
VPTLAFFHGGGFTIGDLDSHDMQCRTLCHELGAVVLSSDYRLAPESPFPAAAEDAIAATRWAREKVAELGGDPARLAVGGDSAGGNLAAVVTQQLRGEEPGIAAQLLIYPVTDLVSERPSHRENGRGYFLTIDEMEWFHANYLPDAEAGRDPLASPLHADDLAGLPPAVIATAEFDPLRDDGDAYAEALVAAGVRVIHRRFDGLVHGFFGLGPFSAMADAAIRQVCADLRELLG